MNYDTRRFFTGSDGRQCFDTVDKYSPASPDWRDDAAIDRENAREEGRARDAELDDAVRQREAALQLEVESEFEKEALAR